MYHKNQISNTTSQLNGEAKFARKKNHENVLILLKLETVIVISYLVIFPEWLLFFFMCCFSDVLGSNSRIGLSCS